MEEWEAEERNMTTIKTAFGNKSVSKRAGVCGEYYLTLPPSKRLALAAIEAMPGSFADGIRFALGMLPEDEWPDAVTSAAKLHAGRVHRHRMRAYLCDECGRWHLSNEEKR